MSTERLDLAVELKSSLEVPGREAIPLPGWSGQAREVADFGRREHPLDQRFEPPVQRMGKSWPNNR